MPRSLLTAADVLGDVVVVSSRHEALGDGWEDECNECGARLRPLLAVFLADTGRYCSRRCADSHGAFLAEEMNRRRGTE